MKVWLKSLAQYWPAAAGLIIPLYGCAVAIGLYGCLTMREVSVRSIAIALTDPAVATMGLLAFFLAAPSAWAVENRVRIIGLPTLFVGSIIVLRMLVFFSPLGLTQLQSAPRTDLIWTRPGLLVVLFVLQVTATWMLSRSGPPPASSDSGE